MSAIRQSGYPGYTYLSTGASMSTVLPVDSFVNPTMATAFVPCRSFSASITFPRMLTGTIDHQAGAGSDEVGARVVVVRGEGGGEYKVGVGVGVRWGLGGCCLVGPE